MVREDLIEGAVTFLQDPSVATAPLEQRLAFLRSKNLTQEEIDVSLARVGQSTSSQAASPTTTQQYRSPVPQQQYASSYQQQPAYWPQQPPPDLPRRDWRDWFIMATVVGGVGYALYWTAARYVAPLISPPTPPQLTQDKEAIDASFDKAFALLDQLATDTQELKDSEQQRSTRLDRALSEVEGVLGRMKDANEAREREGRRMAKEIDELKEAIPRAMERERESMDARLRDLGGEMKSLKTLVANRMAGPPLGAQQQQPQQGAGLRGANPPYGSQQPPPQPTSGGGVNGTSSSTPSGNTTADANGAPHANGTSQDGKAVSNILSDRSATSSPYGGRALGGRAQIPAWQLAAKKRNEETKTDKAGSGAATSAAQDVAQSGTAVSDVDGEK